MLDLPNKISSSFATKYSFLAKTANPASSHITLYPFLTMTPFFNHILSAKKKNPPRLFLFPILITYSSCCLKYSKRCISPLLVTKVAYRL